MKKIYFSALLTAVVGMAGLKLAGWQHASPLGETDREGLFIGEVKTSADSTAPEPMQVAGRPGNWRTVVASAETRLARPDTAAAADPVLGARFIELKTVQTLEDVLHKSRKF